MAKGYKHVLPFPFSCITLVNDQGRCIMSMNQEQNSIPECRIVILDVVVVPGRVDNKEQIRSVCAIFMY